MWQRAVSDKPTNGMQTQGRALMIMGDRAVCKHHGRRPSLQVALPKSVGHQCVNRARRPSPRIEDLSAHLQALGISQRMRRRSGIFSPRPDGGSFKKLSRTTPLLLRRKLRTTSHAGVPALSIDIQAVQECTPRETASHMSHFDSPCSDQQWYCADLRPAYGWGMEQALTPDTPTSRTSPMYLPFLAHDSTDVSDDVDSAEASDTVEGVDTPPGVSGIMNAHLAFGAY